MLTKLLKYWYIVIAIIVCVFIRNYEHQKCDLKISKTEAKATRIMKEKNIEIDKIQLEYNKTLLKYRRKKYNSCKEVYEDINKILQSEI